MADLKLFRKQNNLTQDELGEYLGIKKSFISRIENGFNKLSQEKLSKLLENNLGWNVSALLQVNENEEVYSTNAEQLGGVVSAEVVEEIVEKAKKEAKEELAVAVSVPIVSEDVAVASNIDLEAYIEDNGDELEKFNIAAILEPVQVAERVKSSSMRSVLNNGDVVFLRFINAESMVSGKTYYFELRGLPRMLRIVKFEEDKLRLIAANPKYDDIVISRDRVKKVAKIVCSMRFNFDDTNSDLDDIRKKKDEQINIMIEAQIAQTSGFLSQLDKFNERENKMIQDFSERENRLIDILEKKL